MTVLIGWFVVNMVATAVVVGIATYAILARFQIRPPSRVAPFAFLGLFAVVDLSFMPLAWILDVTLTVGNQEIASFLELTADTKLTEFMEPGVIDFIGWALQAAIAVVVGPWATKKAADNAA